MSNIHKFYSHKRAFIVNNIVVKNNQYKINTGIVKIINKV